MENTTTMLLEGGHSITYRTFITGRQALDLKNTEAATDNEKEALVIKKMVELVVVKLDDIETDIYEKVLDLPVADFTAIVEKVSEVVSGKKN